MTDKEFLIKLQNELKTQDHDGNAAPRFWVIRDYHDVRVAEGEGRMVAISTDDGTTYESIDELMQEIDGLYNCALNDDDTETVDVLESVISGEVTGLEDVVEYLKGTNTGDFDIIYLEKQPYVVQDTLFLTKEEAVSHIKRNNYHYTSEVHTYAMTAWRSPQVERLLKILEEMDWERLHDK